MKARRAFLAHAHALAAGAVFASAARAADGSFFTGGKAAAAAPTMADFEAAEAALADLWSKLPYGTRHAMFVSAKSDVFGGYDKRPSSAFAAGEPLIAYFEPVGYGYKDLGGGRLQLGVTTDFEVLTRAGKVLGGQKAFQTARFASRYHNREFFLNLTITLDGIDPGDYTLAFTLHDDATQRATRVELPFSIKS